MNSLKVFHYSPLSLNEPGGVERHISCLSQELKNLGCDVTTGVIPPSQVAILHSHGDKLPPHSLIAEKHYKKWIHTFHGTSIGRGFACREFLSIRNYLAGFQEAKAAHAADALIHVSANVEKQVKEFYFVNSKKKSVIIPNAATHIKSVQRNSLQNPYFLYLGRGSDFVKNTKFLQNIFSDFRIYYPQITLAVAPGDGFTATDGIIFLGKQNQIETASLLAQAIALLLPSLYEGDPLVAWEAMSYGTPIITTSRVLSVQKPTPYPAVQIIEPRSARELFIAMENFLNNPPQRVPKIRTWKLAAEETLQFYKTVIA